MILYHYTTLDSLALILKSKKIRFSKLTTVDDPVEYSYIKDNINPAQYVFVSCWTSSSFENIPQWKMYANGGHGVRIGLSSTMFSFKKNDGGNMIVFPNIFFEDKNYYILPVLSETEFLSDIIYTEQPLSKFNYIYSNVNELPVIDFKELGKYKMIDWQFQKEKRFRLYVVPKIGGKIPCNFLGELIYPSINHIDIPINEDVFDEMKITLGPYMTESEKIIATALVRQFVQSAEVKSSVFSND